MAAVSSSRGQERVCGPIPPAPAAPPARSSMARSRIMRARPSGGGTLAILARAAAARRPPEACAYRPKGARSARATSRSKEGLMTTVGSGSYQYEVNESWAKLPGRLDVRSGERGGDRLARSRLRLPAERSADHRVRPRRQLPHLLGQQRHQGSPRHRHHRRRDLSHRPRRPRGAQVHPGRQAADGPGHARSALGHGGDEGHRATAPLGRALQQAHRDGGGPIGRSLRLGRLPKQPGPSLLGRGRVALLVGHARQAGAGRVPSAAQPVGRSRGIRLRVRSREQPYPGLQRQRQVRLAMARHP